MDDLAYMDASLYPYDYHNYLRTTYEDISTTISHGDSPNFPDANVDRFLNLDNNMKQAIEDPFYAHISNTQFHTMPIKYDNP
jgi:hypothetical protein